MIIPIMFQCSAPAEAGGALAVLQFDIGPSHHAIEWPMQQIDDVIDRLVRMRDEVRKAQSGLVGPSGAPLPMRQSILGGPNPDVEVLATSQTPAPIPHEERAYYGPPPPLERHTRPPSNQPGPMPSAEPARAIPDEENLG